MVFSSHLFLFYFLPVALGVYYASPRRVRHLALTLLSYLFYGWSGPLFMGLMLLSTLIDYTCGLAISGQLRAGAWSRPVPLLEPGGRRTAGQKAALAVALACNLALLGFFKYYNFAAANYDAIVTLLGVPGAAIGSALRVALPLGISFYTFQSMSYAIDVYRGHARAVRRFIDYACYVAMFPQLVAGPIIRFQEVAAQLEDRSHTLEKFARGAALVSLGLAKKVLLANPCGRIADAAFAAGALDAADAWFGAAAYAFQIYFDFSGYSDMAIGLGLMLGFVFPRNFDAPYRAASITEFWRRWHISLSTWLRDNLYIPLGGNRLGDLRTYANLMVVMLLGGLWHGASWNFVAWGGAHGVMLALERWWGRRSLYEWLPRHAQVAVTFLLLLVTWVLFRAADLPHALAYLGSMMGFGGEPARLVGGLMYQPYYVATFIVAALVTWLAPQAWDWTGRITWPKVATVAVLLWLAIVAMTTQAYSPFIYFIF